MAQKSGVSTFADGNTSMFCQAKTDPRASACMQASTLAHESVHAAVCQQQRGFPSTVVVGTWKQQIGLVAVYQNEIAAYQAEIAFLTPLLASLNQSCAGGWKGSVSSNFTMSTAQNDPMPPLKPGLQVHSLNLTYERNQSDTWMFNGTPASISQIAEGIWKGTLTYNRTVVEDSAFQMGPRCGNILAGHSYIKETGNGSGTGGANLLVTMNGPVAHISVQPNENDPVGKIATTRAEQSWGDVVQNDCGHRVSSGSAAPIAGAPEPFPQTGVEFDAPVDPQHPGVLKGGLPKSVPNGGTTTLTWDLTLVAPSH
jgi:hypothetical protein